MGMALIIMLAMVLGQVRNNNRIECAAWWAPRNTAKDLGQIEQIAKVDRQ